MQDYRFSLYIPRPQQQLPFAAPPPTSAFCHVWLTSGRPILEHRTECCAGRPKIGLSASSGPVLGRLSFGRPQKCARQPDHGSPTFLSLQVPSRVSGWLPTRIQSRRPWFRQWSGLAPRALFIWPALHQRLTVLAIPPDYKILSGLRGLAWCLEQWECREKMGRTLQIPNCAPFPGPGGYEDPVTGSF